MKSILIVEDDRALANGICLALKSETIMPLSCNTYYSAKEELKKESFDLIILDINLPDGNGLDLLRDIGGVSPVILLTANDLETDIVIGLESGAADYITKPFSLAVLRARVNTQLRNSSELKADRFVIDDYVFDFGKLEYFSGGLLIDLSKTEQKLLKMLLENKGNTIPRETLVDRIWTDGAEYVDENALSVTVKRLRDKLEAEPSKPSYIKTVYGIGYSWAVK
ncbi:MAG: response regulator transcription factor [Oscillospiraceae bacterium]|nr:response regulator transcription factor [Oscillospiraceae bacterium]